jgi:hypothetical protein
MGTKSFVQIEMNAVFTTTSGKMQFRSGVFDHFNIYAHWIVCQLSSLVVSVVSGLVYDFAH